MVTNVLLLQVFAKYEVPRDTAQTPYSLRSVRHSSAVRFRIKVQKCTFSPLLIKKNQHLLVFSLLVGEPGIDPESWDFISPVAHKNTHVLGRGLIVLLRSEACKTYSGPFETDRSAEMHFFPQPRPHFVRCAWGRTRTADPSLFRRML